MMPNTIRYAAQDISQMDSSSATAMKKKNRLNSRMVSATRKNTLPWTPFLTSAVTSDRASSSSARSSVETCEDASRTSPPMDASPFGEVSADNGMEGSTGGTWLPGVGLATSGSSCWYVIWVTARPARLPAERSWRHRAMEHVG